MRQTRFRQTDRLQKQALRYIERNQQIEREWQQNSRRSSGTRGDTYISNSLWKSKN